MEVTPFRCAGFRTPFYKRQKGEDGREIDRKILATENKLEKVFDINFNMLSEGSNKTPFQRSKKPTKRTIKIVDHIQSNIDIDDTINFVKKAIKNDEETRVKFFNKKSVKFKNKSLSVNLGQSHSKSKMLNLHKDSSSVKLMSNNDQDIEKNSTAFTMYGSLNTINNTLPIQDCKSIYNLSRTRNYNHALGSTHTEFTQGIGLPRITNQFSSTLTPIKDKKLSLSLHNLMQSFKNEEKECKKVHKSIEKIKVIKSEIKEKLDAKANIYKNMEDNTKKKSLFSNKKRLFIYRKRNKDIVVSESVGDALVVNTADITRDKTKKKKLKKLLDNSDLMKIKLTNLVNDAKSRFIQVMK